MTSDLAALIARLREAKEGSRELDCDVYEAVDPNFPKGVATRIEIVHAHPVFATGGYEYAVAPHFTTDLSAAVALCERVLPNDYGWAVRRSSHSPDIPVTRKRYAAEVWDVRTCLRIASGQTDQAPALALCIAILRAKAAAHD